MEIILNHQEKIRIANNHSKDSNFIDVLAEPRNGVNTVKVYDSKNLQYIQIRTDGFEICVFSFDSKEAAQTYPFGVCEDWEIIFESKRD